MIHWYHVWLLPFYIQHIQHYVMAIWPSSNTSTVTLLGLFPSAENPNETLEFSVHSRAMFQAAVMLSQQYKITIEGQLIQYQSVQTHGDVIDVLSRVCQAVSSTSSSTLGIIGPAYSRDAHQIATFAKKIGIPVISYSAADPALSDRYTYQTFYRTVPSDHTAALAITKLFLRYNWTSCVIIYQNDAFGEGGFKAVSETFTDHNLTVPGSLVFDISSLKIKGDLKDSLMNSVTRIVVLWVSSEYTGSILQDALHSDVLGPQFTWVVRATVSLAAFNRSFSDKLVGLLSVEPAAGSIADASINTTLLNAAFQIWQQYEPETFPVSAQIHPYALFAFDATWSLILSLQKLCSTTQNQSCLSFTGPSYCFDRRFVHSNSMMNTMNSIEFTGVSGPIRFSENTTDRINGSYYYAQNAQSTANDIRFTPVLKYAYPYDWVGYSLTGANIISWPGNSLAIPQDQAKLAGVTLRIAVYETPPFTKQDTTLDSSGKNVTKLVGYMPDLIELLRNRTGFIPDIRIAPPNMTYNQLVQLAANGVYDIVVADLAATSVRREIAGFSSPIFDHSLCIIMRKESAVEIELLSYLKPFSRNLWLLVLGACVVASISLCLLEKHDNDSLQERSILSTSAMTLWYSIGTVMGYGVDYHVKTAAGRLLTIGLYLLCLVLAASYTANLASDLTIKKSKGTISGLDDIKKGKISFNRIGIISGSAHVDFYLREVSNGNRNFYPIKSAQHLYASLFAGTIDAAFIATAIGEYVTNNIYCNLTLVGEGFNKGVFGIVTPKQWLYAKDLDVNILALREIGALENLKTKWFESATCPIAEEVSTTMGIDSMSGLFLTFGIIWVLSLFVFIWKKRLICKKCRCILKFRKSMFFKRRTVKINPSTDNQNSSSSSSNV